MEELLNAVAAIVRQVSPDKVDAIAARIRKTDSTKAPSALNGVVGTHLGSGLINQLVDAWRASATGSDELASMLLGAKFMAMKIASDQSIELVWTGPTTPFVATRHTEQALLQVINAAQSTLFITSFVAYDVASVVKALNDASAKDVHISMLLESSSEHGGSINIDVIRKMKSLVPKAVLYAWTGKVEPFLDGRVHAKVAVADTNSCFITSANLTGYAMEKNMEAGILITGGEIPRQLSQHLCALVSTKVVSVV